MVSSYEIFGVLALTANLLFNALYVVNS